MTTVTIEFTTATGDDSTIRVEDPGHEYAPYEDDVRQALRLVPDDAIVTGILVDGRRIEI